MADITTSLGSTSTLAEIQAAYDDNCGYDLSNDLTMCKNYILACRLLLRILTDEASSGESRVRQDRVLLQSELKKAESWRAVNDPDARTAIARSFYRGVSFGSFRQ